MGRALIEYVYAQAEAMGCGRVYWLTHQTNAQAMRLYDTLAERSGFVQYPEDPACGRRYRLTCSLSGTSSSGPTYSAAHSRASTPPA